MLIARLTQHLDQRGIERQQAGQRFVPRERGFQRKRKSIQAPRRKASLVFDVASRGDAVAQDVIDWAGQELGEMVIAVARQLDFQALEFDVVMAGGMFAGGDRLIESMRRTVTGFAPGARLVHLSAPPVLGAALIGMEQAGLKPDSAVRATLAHTYAALV